MAVSPATKIAVMIAPSYNTPLLCCLLFASCVLIVAGCGNDDQQSTSARPSAAHLESSEPLGVTVADERIEPLQLQRSPAQESPSEDRVKVDLPAPAIEPTRLRLPDDRRDVNAERLGQVGIRIHESKRLRLVTDLPDEQVAVLPSVADEVFDALEKYFGTLPDAVDDSSFQVTGYLISDEQKFRQAGLMPSTAFTFAHGKHVNYEFWIFNPAAEYYGRHLLLHEFTHCFMTCESGMNDIPPLWYIEGMAEYFATHKDRTASTTEREWQFGVLPRQFDGFEGWGRISEFRRSFEQSSAKSADELRPLSIAPLTQVMPDSVATFESGFQYASSWALCWLLNNHPLYSREFASLRERRRRNSFLEATDEVHPAVKRKLAIDWLLFSESLVEGFDVERCFPLHADATLGLADLKAGAPLQFTLRADRGWQDSGLRLQSGDSVEVISNGRCAVNNAPQDWVSEPQGVSIEYVRGLPLGRVVAILVDPAGRHISTRLSIGRSSQITAPFDCSVWLQVNDTSNSRHNNAGTFEVRLSAAM